MWGKIINMKVGIILKRKILSLMLTICLAFTGVISTSKIASATEVASIPHVGTEVSGFTVKETAYDQASKSNKILFEHLKTGAKLLVVKNGDINRGFSIKFNTPAENDKGINHIIEHSVLGGSEKYPSSNIIFDVTNTTYVSFANALTYPNMTVYPICSVSEEQLYKSADIYLNAVFNPLLLSEEKIFEREGWRYELADESSPITYNGIVYNEMQGSMGSIESVAIANAMKAIFPNSDQGNNSGGDPSQITRLKYKELIDTYKENYHPSNSFIVLYGDIDYEPFLKMIDEEYLSNYTKKVSNADRDTQQAFSELVEKTYLYPAAAGTDTNNKSVIDLVFATADLKELGEEKFVGLSMAISLLNLESSSLKKAMLESQIAESYNISMDPSNYQPTIHFMATNADPSKSKEFYNLVINELKTIVEEGLDTELLTSSLRSMEFAEALGSNANSGVNAMLNASLYDNLLANPLVDINSYYKKVAANLDQRVLEEILEQNVINNTFAALTVTKPEVGLLEKNQAAISKELAEKKSSMSKEEIKELVKNTADFNTWNSQQTSDEVLKTLRAVELKDITAEVKVYDINETVIDGVALMSTAAAVDAISTMYLNFDMSQLTKEELLYLKFYSDMLNNGMATESRTESQVMNETALKAYGISTSVSAMMDDKKDTSAHPVFTVNYYGFEDEYAETFDLVSDVILQSKVSDISTYGTRTIANQKANFEYLFAEPLNLALYRSLAYTSASYRYANYLNGLDYYKFIISLEKQIATEPSKVVEKIEAIREKAFNKSNLTVLFAGETNALKKFKSSMTDFTAKLSDETYQKADYTLPRPERREALVINSSVQYLVVNSSLSKSHVPSSGKGAVITTMLNNLMLTPEIRLKGGAYGVAAMIEGNNYAAYTYRDSNFVNSLATIGATDEFLQAIIPYMTEEALESYKLSTYASASMSSGEINDALVALINKAQGVTTQDRINKLKEIKSTTLSDIEEYSKYLYSINKLMNYVIVASPSEIEANKDMFDSIISLQ